jgi:hypothetical protein
MPGRIECLVTSPAVASDQGIDYHWCAIVEQSGAIISQDHWKGDRLLLRGNTAQREDVVAVVAGMGYTDPNPPLRHDFAYTANMTCLLRNQIV